VLPLPQAALIPPIDQIKERVDRADPLLAAQNRQHGLNPLSYSLST
jgi:hypothetical protein